MTSSSYVDYQQGVQFANQLAHGLSILIRNRGCFEPLLNRQ